MFETCSLSSVVIRIISNITCSEDIRIRSLQEHIGFQSSKRVLFKLVSNELSVRSHTSTDENSIGFKCSAVREVNASSNTILSFDGLDANSEVELNAIISMELLNSASDLFTKHSFIGHLGNINNSHIDLILKEILNACSSL